MEKVKIVLMILNIILSFGILKKKERIKTKDNDIKNIILNNKKINGPNALAVET